MRVLLSVLCLFCLTPISDFDEDHTRRKRLSRYEAVLTEISSREERDDASDLPDDLRQAIETWTSKG